MTAYAQIIREIDPNADVERVLDIADGHFRFFGDMSRKDWAACVRAARQV